MIHDKYDIDIITLDNTHPIQIRENALLNLDFCEEIYELMINIIYPFLQEASFLDLQKNKIITPESKIILDNDNSIGNNNTSST